MIFVLDNYDSFVFNLVQYLGGLGAECAVFRNDEIGVDEVALLDPELVLLSPGPGDPRDAGISVDLVRRLAGTVPLFGVCLGHQSIGRAFGADVVHARVPMHGKCSVIRHDGQGVFGGLPERLTVTRYHSLVIAPETLPPDLVVSAWSEDGEVMALRHRDTFVEGVQFHPESLFTEHGSRMVENLMTSAGAYRRAKGAYDR